MHPAIVRHTDIGRGAADIEGDDAGMADRTTSTMWRAASRWRCSCARARRRRAPRSAPSSSTWCAASAGTGRAPGSPSGEIQPLRTDRGHGLVRGQRRRLHLRPGRQQRVAPPLIRGRRRPQGAPRRGRRGQDAGLRRVRLRRPVLGPPAPGRRPAGGKRAGLRRPLHRHLARRRRPPSL